MNYRVVISGIAVSMSLGLCGPVRADGIPEPSLVLYGVVSDTSSGGSRVSFGTLTWTFQPVGSAAPVVVATGVLTNINDQFSYVLRVRCETALNGSVSTGVLQLASSPTL